MIACFQILCVLSIVTICILAAGYTMLATVDLALSSATEDTLSPAAAR